MAKRSGESSPLFLLPGFLQVLIDFVGNDEFAFFDLIAKLV